MTRSIFNLLLLLALVLLSGRAHAQQPPSGKGDVSAADAVLRDKAIGLLESVADQIGTLQSPENRARIGSNIAALIWKYDEPRGRTLLVSVQNDINTGLRQVDDDDRGYNSIRTVLLKLRIDTVERIAKFDAETALAFLNATEPEPDSQKSEDLDYVALSLELRLANQVAAENPDLALKLGRRSLARGFSDDLLSLFKRIQKKDKEKAGILYKEIVAKLISTDLRQQSSAFYFARNLVRWLKPPLVDDQPYRELIKLFIDTAVKNGCEKTSAENDKMHFCREFGVLFRQMENVDSARTTGLKQWEVETSGAEYDPTGFQEVEQVARSGTIDEVLALAEQHPHLQGHIQWRAIMMAEESGDVERARKLTNEFIDDKETREAILARLDRQQNWRATAADKLAEIQVVLNKIPNQPGKVSFLLHMANHFGGKDRKSVLKLLSQTSQIIDTMKSGREKTEFELSVATLYCLENDERGMDKMQSLIPTLNELIGAAIKLDGYDSHNVRDGEWNMSNEGSVGSLLTILAQGAGYFAWCDFDRALNLAGQFERTEIRLMAQLKLAQAILEGRPKRMVYPFVPFWDQ